MSNVFELVNRYIKEDKIQLCPKHKRNNGYWDASGNWTCSKCWMNTTKVVQRE